MLTEERKMMRDLILSQAKYFLEEFDEFYPFGCVIRNNGELRPFGISGEDEHPEVGEVIEIIEQAFADGAESERYVAVSMAVDVLFAVPGTEGKTDAIEIRMDSKAEGPLNVYIPYRRENGKVKFIELYADAGTLVVFQGSI